MGAVRQLIGQLVIDKRPAAAWRAFAFAAHLGSV
jgi:hypothetical protein